MRDAAAIEEAGVPVITLIHDVFEGAARLQADALGCGGLNMVVFPQGKPEQSDEDVDRLAHEAFGRLVAFLATS